MAHNFCDAGAVPYQLTDIKPTRSWDPVQLEEHCSGNEEVMDLNPVQA